MYLGVGVLTPARAKAISSISFLLDATDFIDLNDLSEPLIPPANITDSWCFTIQLKVIALTICVSNGCLSRSFCYCLFLYLYNRWIYGFILGFG